MPTHHQEIPCYFAEVTVIIGKKCSGGDQLRIVAGCADAAVPAVVPPEQTWPQFVRALQELRCDPALYPDALNHFPDAEHCRNADWPVRYLLRAIDDFDVAFDPVAAQACLAWINVHRPLGVADAYFLDDLSFLGEPCGVVLRGTRPNGVQSWTSLQCASGARKEDKGTCAKVCVPAQPVRSKCDLLECGPGVLCRGGVCMPLVPVALGQSCVGIYCAEGECVELEAGIGQCQPFASGGEPCDGPSSYGIVGHHCGKGLRCAGASTYGAGICLDPVKEGHACHDSTDCVGELACDEVTHSCQPLPIGGEPCNSPWQCAPYGQVACVGPKPDQLTCTPIGWIDAPCEATNTATTTAPCAEGLYCAAATQKCTLLGGVGQPCGWSDQCAFPLACVAGACQAGGAGVGQACGQATRCAANLDCVDGKCAPLGAVGAACGYPIRCAGNLVCVSGHCVPKLGEGQPCDDADQCTAGLYCDTEKCAKTDLCNF